MKGRQFADALVAIACGLFAISARAEEGDCYVSAHVPAEHRSITKANVVMLDETVVFDLQLRQHITEQLVALLEPGSDMRVVAFSAYLEGRHATPVLRLRLAAPLAENVRR